MSVELVVVVVVAIVAVGFVIRYHGNLSAVEAELKKAEQTVVTDVKSLIARIRAVL